MAFFFIKGLNAARIGFNSYPDYEGGSWYHEWTYRFDFFLKNERKFWSYWQKDQKSVDEIRNELKVAHIHSAVVKEVERCGHNCPERGYL